MALKPEFSIMAGLATATVVYGVYQVAMPSVADVRSLQPQNRDIASAERSASWVSAGVVAGVSLIARDPTIFIIGGVVVIGMAWMHRHANAVHPDTGTASTPRVPAVSQAEVPQQYHAPTAPAYAPTF